MAPLNAMWFFIMGALIRASPLRARVLNCSLARAEPIMYSVIPWPEQSLPCAVNEKAKGGGYIVWQAQAEPPSCAANEKAKGGEVHCLAGPSRARIMCCEKLGRFESHGDE